MRTTIDLGEELLRTAKSLGTTRKQTLAQVISDLVWKGLPTDTATVEARGGFPVLPVRPGARPVTPEHGDELLDQPDREFRFDVAF